MRIEKISIIKVRSETYKDFLLNLILYIDKYYIDRESMNTDIIIKNHFNWCYNKVCDEFILEELNFKNNNELYTFLFNMFYENYYINYKISEEEKKSKLINLINKVFDVDNLSLNNLKGDLIPIIIFSKLFAIFEKSIQNNVLV